MSWGIDFIVYIHCVEDDVADDWEAEVADQDVADNWEDDADKLFNEKAVIDKRVEISLPINHFLLISN